jgi:hypothetical protein
MDTISAEESLERATADVELLLSAYSEEARAVNATVPPHSLPLHVQLLLSQTASLTLEFTRGYPVETAVLIHSYRCQAHEKARLEATVTAVREAALHALEDQTEGGFPCCATARETWETASSEEAAAAKAAAVDASPSPANVPPWAEHHVWITSETTLTDRKSVFQAHVCRIGSESNVRPALVQLLDGNSKLQRASHNMVSSVLVRVVGLLSLAPLPRGNTKSTPYQLTSPISAVGLPDTRSECQNK